MPVPTLLRDVDTESLLRHCEKRLVQLDDARRPWLDFCYQVANELLPNRLPYLLDPQSDQRGGEQNSHVCDSVGHTALATAAAGIASATMPRTSVWFELALRNQRDNDSVRVFLDAARDVLLSLHNQSNANFVFPECNKEWIAFGTGVVLFLDDEARGFRLDPLTVGEYWIAEDQYGEVDTVYRKFTMTVGQLVAEFGIDRVSDSTRNEYQKPDGGGFDTIVRCVHAIEPDRDGKNPDPNPDHPWRSVYYEDSGDKTRKGVLAVRGYDHFPALVWRASRLPGCAYGYGAGHDVLPHLIRLRKMVYHYGNAMAKKADPPVSYPAGMNQHEVKMLPGGKSALANGQKIEQTQRVELELKELGEEIQKTRQDIRDVLGATLVASLRNITRQMTATEAEIRTKQDLNEFLPGLARLDAELHAPYIAMLWRVAETLGLLPDLPGELDGQPIDPQMVSPLALRQREGESSAMLRWVAQVGEMAKAQVGAGMPPNVIQNVNLDELARRLARNGGVPAVCLTDMRQMMQMRAAQAEQALAEKQAAAVQQAADVGKTVSEAVRNEGTQQGKAA